MEGRQMARKVVLDMFLGGLAADCKQIASKNPQEKRKS